MLNEGELRFGELQRRVPTVSKKMLTTTLRGLERDGYLTRKVTPSIPPRVDYGLTPMGRDVLKPLNTLARWALDHRADVEAARHAYDEGNSLVAKRPASSMSSAAAAPKRARAASP
jgi:DNA-binding HxlR family transcriptional regulator